MVETDNRSHATAWARHDIASVAELLVSANYNDNFFHVCCVCRCLSVLS